MLSYDFGGKVAVITGGASGMGRAIAQRFAAAGAKVVIADMSVDTGQQTVELVTIAGGEALFVATDVSKSESVADLIAKTVRRFGRVDFGCNAAAINIELDDSADEAEFDRVVAVNQRGTYLCIKYQAAQMQKQGTGGAIVNFSSATALRSNATFQNGYVSSKSAVMALTRLAAMRHTKDGIRVNSIIPGAIDTPMLRKGLEMRGLTVEEMTRNYSLTGAAGTPEDIAEAALWLCSDYSAYVIGVNLPVDGGALINK
jgi:NAD(P)-dependent dehydrogenase (short-subunit alcohol dehydrogenase family)